MGSSPDETTHLIHPDPSSPDELNTLLAGWELYRIESLVGEGGMARVYKAYDPKLKRYVALKFIRTDDENLKKRLLREAQAQAQIDHDHVCKIYEVGVVEGKSYIAMQLVKGGTFRELAQKMSLEQKVLLLVQVCEAVQAAHRVGIIHRDIKPTNIMVERKEDGSFTPYIMDFGIAREISEPGLTATEVVMGTPAFMAPEQMLGDSSMVDRRADIYSLGSTMYYAYARSCPY
jgi:eukaryotic-like serine/threonine-protein kinase